MKYVQQCGPIWHPKRANISDQRHTNLLPQNGSFGGHIDRGLIARAQQFTTITSWPMVPRHRALPRMVPGPRGTLPTMISRQTWQTYLWIPWHTHTPSFQREVFPAPNINSWQITSVSILRQHITVTGWANNIPRSPMWM